MRKYLVEFKVCSRERIEVDALDEFDARVKAKDVLLGMKKTEQRIIDTFVHEIDDFE